MIIRPFRASDVEELIKIAQVSFAEEFTASGATPASFAQQMRMAARGRMIPFRIATAVAGYKWEMLVAEVEGSIVGFGGYLGRKHMELVNLMVAPPYRRQGIGQAILQKRLRRLEEKGYPFVTTTILASNRASLGNVFKQGFEIYDRYVILEKVLSFTSGTKAIGGKLLARDVRPVDLTAFKQLEAQIAAPLLLELQGSASSQYLLSFGERLIDRLTGSQQQSWIFTKNGEVIGFLKAGTSGHQTKGALSRPVVADENLKFLPEMLQEAAGWLAKLQKAGIQISVPEERQSLISELQDQGWESTQRWVRLMKRFRK